MGLLAGFSGGARGTIARESSDAMDGISFCQRNRGLGDMFLFWHDLGKAVPSEAWHSSVVGSATNGSGSGPRCWRADFLLSL